LLAFYCRWLSLAWGAASWTRAINGTLSIFLPIAYVAPTTEFFKTHLPNAYVWLSSQPGWLTWLPLGIFLSVFCVRFALAPYWIYQEKVRELETREPTKIKGDLARFHSLMEGLSKSCLEIGAVDKQLELTAHDLLKEAQSYIFNRLPPHCVVMYGSDNGLVDATLSFPNGVWPSAYKRKLYRRLAYRMARLQELINRSSFA
jgi:hypothetical protein